MFALTFLNLIVFLTNVMVVFWWHWIKLTYCAWIWVVCHLIPCCNKDPVCVEVHAWKVIINVSCSLLEDTATGVLIVVDLTNLSVVKICPEWSNDVFGCIQWEPLRCVCAPWTLKCQVSIVVDLEMRRWNSIYVFFFFFFNLVMDVICGGNFEFDCKLFSLST